MWGRYKFKLSLANRIRNHFVAEDIKDGNTKKVLVKAGSEISEEMAWKIQNSGVNVVYLDVEGKCKGYRKFYS